jgi:hypothetical protein
MAKDKRVAAALDFFIWGSGHAYLGYRKALGFPWVIWTLALAVITLLDAVVSRNLYYVSYSGPFGLAEVAYNTGEQIAIIFIPYLVVGGLMLFDLMKKGALPAIVSFAAPSPQSSPLPPTQQPQTAAQPGAMICPSCRSPVTRADAFCPSCGAKLQWSATEAPAPVTAGGSKVCNSCGTPNPAGYAFCKRCGSKLA